MGVSCEEHATRINRRNVGTNYYHVITNTNEKHCDLLCMQSMHSFFRNKFRAIF